jgi:hypothetical protein
VSPIRPEVGRGYPAGEHLHALLTPERGAAIEALRPLRDPARDPLLWEALVAERLGGTLTPPGCPYDVDLGHLTVEVKLSHELAMRFRSGPRRVFRWAGLRDAADVSVVIGLDAGRRVHTWAIPRDALRATRTLTTVVPGARRGAKRSPLAGYAVPALDLLDGVLCSRRRPDVGSAA